MYRFKVSAPGTMLLCGQRNKTCVAAGLDMRTVLTFSSFPTKVVRRDFIEINFSSIQLHMKIPLRIFLLYFYNKNYDYADKRCMLLRTVKNFITFLTGFPGNYEPSNHAHQLSLQAFFFLLVSISYKKGIIIKSSFIVILSTELPIGEGLGSSASFVVCLAACFWRWSLLQKGKVRYRFKSKDLIYISEYAYICDNIVFNSSTIIDIIISTYGMIKVFKGDTLRSNDFPDVPSMKILLVFSNVSQKIDRSMETKVKEHSCSSVDFILNSMETISIKIIHMNQGLLRALGTSHPSLDIICGIARDFSLGGKIAATGGGGYAFILLLPNNSDEYIQDLIKMFESHNFPAKIANLNCSGDIIHMNQGLLKALSMWHPNLDIIPQLLEVFHSRRSL
ncbi:mevalonate kinase-like [Mycetomoellerius zeteki]|uniref:mevalonate kinase-like n=1 Tax=Mycetomoellerius zeteki TaxID=64791 RepID=UPI00084E42A9|nr:PREDICTED: mevalonate kinase-like [Trachymyrmex zeteki]